MKKKPKLGQTVYCIDKRNYDILEDKVFMKNEYSFLLYPFINGDWLWQWWYEDYNETWFMCLDKAMKKVLDELEKQGLNKNKELHFVPYDDGENDLYVLHNQYIKQGCRVKYINKNTYDLPYGTFGKVVSVEDVSIGVKWDYNIGEDNITYCSCLDLELLEVMGVIDDE